MARAATSWPREYEAAHPAEALVAVHRDIGEHELGMLSLQREKSFANGVGDREHHPPATLPQAHNLLGAEVDLGPPQRNAFFQPQT